MPVSPSGQLIVNQLKLYEYVDKMQFGTEIAVYFWIKPAAAGC
jgi:hypothetical protein